MKAKTQKEQHTEKPVDLSFVHLVTAAGKLRSDENEKSK